MHAFNPFRESTPDTARENELTAQARQGGRAAIEELIRMHGAWLFNIILRMVPDFEEAEDLFQETVIKCFTRLSGFRGKSRFRTWLYRIAVNHIISCRRRPQETATKKSVKTMKNDRATEEFLSQGWPDPKLAGPDIALLIQEVRIKCMLGMLMCLDRKQRLIFILGSILGVDSRRGGELVGMTGAAWRQALSRARRKIDHFTSERCGLLNRTKPCRCERVVPAGLANGWLDPARLRYNRPEAKKIREAAVIAQGELEEIINERCAAVYREQPFYDPRDAAEKIVGILRTARFLES